MRHLLLFFMCLGLYSMSWTQPVRNNHDQGDSLQFLPELQSNGLFTSHTCYCETCYFSTYWQCVVSTSYSVDLPAADVTTRFFDPYTGNEIVAVLHDPRAMIFFESENQNEKRSLEEPVLVYSILTKKRKQVITYLGEMDGDSFQHFDREKKTKQKTERGGNPQWLRWLFWSN